MSLDLQRREELVDRWARRIAAWGMLAPAILFLETYRPLAFIGAQLLWVAEPFLGLAFKRADLHDFATLLDDDAGTQTLLARLEAFRQDQPSSH